MASGEEYWREYERRQAELQKKCEEEVKRVFGGTPFTVLRVTPAVENGTCVVDFKPIDVDPYEYVNCDDYCSLAYEQDYADYGDELDEEAYDECLKTCEENVESALVSSVEFKPGTLEVVEATIAMDCTSVLGENAAGRIVNRFAEAGCFVNPDASEFIHPHELAEYGYEVEEEPTICYVHPKSMNNMQCRLDKLIRVI